MYPLQYCTITLKKESIGVGSFFVCIAFAVSASDLQADAGEESAWGGGAIDVARIAGQNHILGTLVSLNEHGIKHVTKLFHLKGIGEQNTPRKSDDLQGERCGFNRIDYFAFIAFPYFYCSCCSIRLIFL